MPTVTDRIDSSVLAHANPGLGLIASYGTGKSITSTSKPAYARGITVTNTPGVLTEDTADMTMALILAVARRLVEGERLARSGEWPGWSPTSMLGHRITGKRLGHPRHGPDRQRGRAAGARLRIAIHYHNRRRVPEGWRPSSRRPIGKASIRCSPAWTSSAQLPAHAGDLPSAAARRSPAADRDHRQHLARRSDRRGGVDPHAPRRQLAGAGLDVFEHEPAINPKLRELDNVVLLPHMGSATIEGIDMGEKVVINIKTFVDGHRPRIGSCRGSCKPSGLLRAGSSSGQDHFRDPRRSSPGPPSSWQNLAASASPSAADPVPPA